MRWPHAVRHVLVVDGTGRVVVAADAADAAGDEVRVARVLALHEDAVAAEDRRRAVALDHSLLREVDLRVDAEASDDACDRVPRHLDDVGAGLAPTTPTPAPFSDGHAHACSVVSLDRPGPRAVFPPVRATKAAGH